MKTIKKWIICLFMLAFVVTTMPNVSHAGMPHGDASAVAVKSEQVVAPAHEDCAGHDGQKQGAENTADKKDSSNKPCCDGNACKCIGSSCSSSAKIFGTNSFSLNAMLATKALFLIEEQTADSNFHTRIKRPPRA